MKFIYVKIVFILFLTSCSSIPQISNEKKEGLYFYRSAGLSSMYGYGYPITLELNGERFKLGVGGSTKMRPIIGRNSLKKISTGFVGEFPLNETIYYFDYRDGEYLEIGVSNAGPFEVEVKNSNNTTIEVRQVYEQKFEEKIVSNLPRCSGISIHWYNCFGTVGQDGVGKYVGEFKSGRFGGNGVYITSNGIRYEGYFENGVLVRESNKNKPDNNTNINIDNEIKKINEVINREQAKLYKSINLQITNSIPDINGTFNIEIKTNTDTASLKINGEEQGGRADGDYKVKKVARAGQETKFTIIAIDINGNTDSKTISITRQVTASNQFKYAELNPNLVKTQPSKDAVAIIIGIADYKKLPKADYANDDARIFYDYAIRGLGVKPENVKLLIDIDADQAEIIKTFKNWLPPRVKSTTDVFVYYSGHGLPSADGQNLYLLPHQADRDIIEDTAISQSRINSAIQATKPKSVTIFLDSCYSGAARTGQTLIASARPILLKANSQIFPSDFTVFSASKSDQISSSSNDLKHGIFSYYLMKGMEGDADANKDGKITTGEMHNFLTENVAKQASLANRVQNPQLTGDVNRVLVGR